MLVAGFPVLIEALTLIECFAIFVWFYFIQSDTKTLLLEQERAIVKQKFETIGKALSDGESEKAVW